MKLTGEAHATRQKVSWESVQAELHKDHGMTAMCVNLSVGQKLALS